MSNIDKEYYKLVKRILDEGYLVKNRTGVDSIKLPNWHFEFDLNEEFPLLSLKQTFIRQAALEILWIYQVQSNEVSWLKDRNINIWNEWEIDKEGYWSSTQNVPKGDGTLEKKEVKKFFGKELSGTIGKAYGYQVRKHNMIQNLIKTIKTNPTDRGMVMSLWQDDDIKEGVLRPCVWSSEWDVTNGKLNSIVNQRSCDVPLGLPFNISQYALLQSMLAQVTNLEVGKMTYMIKDPHIYVNQIEAMKEVVRRAENLEELESPKLWLNPEINDFFQFDNSKDCKDVKVLNYKHHGKIDIPISV